MIHFYRTRRLCDIWQNGTLDKLQTLIVAIHKDTMIEHVPIIGLRHCAQVID